MTEDQNKLPKWMRNKIMNDTIHICLVARLDHHIEETWGLKV